MHIINNPNEGRWNYPAVAEQATGKQWHDMVGAIERGDKTRVEQLMPYFSGPMAKTTDGKTLAQIAQYHKQEAIVTLLFKSALWNKNSNIPEKASAHQWQQMLEAIAQKDTETITKLMPYFNASSIIQTCL